MVGERRRASDLGRSTKAVQGRPSEKGAWRATKRSTGNGRRSTKGAEGPQVLFATWGQDSLIALWGLRVKGKTSRTRLVVVCFVHVELKSRLTLD